MTVTITKCIACLEVTEVDADQFCAVCEKLNDSDGVTLALLKSEETPTDV